MESGQADTAVSIRDAATAAYEQYGYTPMAVEEMVVVILANAMTVRAAVEMAAKEALREVQREARCVIARDCGSPRTYSRRFRDSIVVACGKFYNWPLPDGTRLSVATRTQVMKSAVGYRQREIGNARQAAFLEAVAAGMQDGQMVADAWTEAQLAGLMKEAMK